MAVYYKFKSAKDYDSIPMDGPFIAVGILKEKIYESKHLGRGTDYDLVVTNAQTNEEYLDEAMLIPKNTSVLIRRVPGRPPMPIVTDSERKMEDKVEYTEPERTSFLAAESSATKYPGDPDWDDYGDDLYEIPEVMTVQTSYQAPDAQPTDKADEDSKIKALIDTPALAWQHQGPDGFGPGRGFGRGGRMMNGRGIGHYIQHCPTNGDPNFDIKRVKPPTGIPKSMLMANPDGSYKLPSGDKAVLRPNEAAFEKEIEGLPSTRSVGDLPPELHCPLCKEVMKDAVLTSKCCFNSFCDKCIRNYIMSKSVCVCGATNTLADDLLPNKTLRDTINRILESGGNSSADNAGSTFQVQDMESARCPQPKIPSPTVSAASKGDEKQLPQNEEPPKFPESKDDVKPVLPQQQILERVRTTKVADASEATRESMSVKEPASQGSIPLVEEEVQQRMASGDAGKKRKKKKIRVPVNDMQWRNPQDLAAENYMMPMGPAAYNPYWNGMQPGMGMEGYMTSYGGPMPYMGYGPIDMPFGGLGPQDPFGAQGYMMPMVPPQRDPADFCMGMNGMNGMDGINGLPIMSKEEFEARKADLRRKRENERQVQSREFSKDREYRREVSSGGDGPPMKSKSHHHDRERERDRDREREREHDHEEDHHRQKRHRSESSSAKPSAQTTASAKPASSAASAAAAEAAAAAERKHKASVFSRISFPEGEVSKKRKASSSSTASAAAPSPAAEDTKPSAHHHHKELSSSSLANGFYDEYKSSSTAKAACSGTGSRKTMISAASMEYESSDDDRHFKRKPSRYEASPPQAAEQEGPSGHSRGGRDRDRDRDRRQR
ncbi:hypothetical protein C1H46_008945 [Malus baccata]|uniref:DWNN domain-containing protein n=1 Tax=Malus baccata TaxID=106549 RepID=A0A540N4I1_MALBA|nr:hypothetical protein C1H46_008945 [Malus baccata]